MGTPGFFFFFGRWCIFDLDWVGQEDLSPFPGVNCHRSYAGTISQPWLHKVTSSQKAMSEPKFVCVCVYVFGYNF